MDGGTTLDNVLIERLWEVQIRGGLFEDYETPRDDAGLGHSCAYNEDGSIRRLSTKHLSSLFQFVRIAVILIIALFS